MRRLFAAFAPGMILVVAVFARASARDDGAGPAAAPKGLEPPVEAERPARREPWDHGSLDGIFVSNYPRMASFFFATKPASCHFSFPLRLDEMDNYWMHNDALEYIGPDGSGHYRHYRALKPDALKWHAPYPTDWYIPMDIRSHPGVWYRTDEPGAKPVFYGKPVEFGQMTGGVKRKGSRSMSPAPK